MDVAALTKWIIRPNFHAHRLLFESIESVEAGCWWKVTDHRIEKHRYFHVLTDLDVDRLTSASMCDTAALVDKFEHLLRTSVELHLASDVPLATMCSGGVDSSLITAYARDLQPDMHAYVADIAFHDGEGGQAERVGRLLGVAVRRIKVDREKFLRLWPVGIWNADGPLCHRSDPALLAVTQACREDGIKVLLTGEGSDELFGGYSRYRSTWRRWRRAEWPWTLLPGSRRRARRLARSAEPLGRNAGDELHRRLAVTLDPDDDFIRQRILGRLAPVEPASDRAFIGYCLAELYGNLSTLLHRHDRMGMAASMEMRVPFIENHIIDLAMHLPLRGRYRRGHGKWVVKAAASRRRIPANVVYVKKKGFPTPSGFVRGAEQLLHGGRLAGALGWTSQTTEEVVTTLGHDDLLCFHVVGIELWLRIFFGGEDVDELGDRLIALAA